jgi:hypothetical protein
MCVLENLMNPEKSLIISSDKKIRYNCIWLRR